MRFISNFIFYLLIFFIPFLSFSFSSTLLDIWINENLKRRFELKQTILEHFKSFNHANNFKKQYFKTAIKFRSRQIVLLFNKTYLSTIVCQGSLCHYEDRTSVSAIKDKNSFDTKYDKCDLFLTNCFLTYKSRLREDRVQKDRQAILQRYLVLQKN